MQAGSPLLSTVAILIGALALLVLTGCSEGGTGAAVGSLVFEVDSGADSDDEALVRKVAADARRYYEKQLGRRLQGDVVINLVMQDSLSKPAYAAKEGTFFMGNPAWGTMTDFDKKYLVAHEIFHTFQYNIGGLKAFVIAGWLIEGTADVAAFKFLDAEGDLKYAAALTARKLYMSPSRLGEFLTVHESEYALAFVGADYLLRGRGLKSLVAFYTELPSLPGIEWRPAFEKAFGRTADAFIEDFERARGR